jgi:hypothetical protein
VLRRILSVLLLLPGAASADDLWVEGAAATSDAPGHRFSVSRSLGNFGFDGVIAGASLHRYGESSWTLLDAGFARQAGGKLIVQGGLHVGPGQIDGDHIVFRKFSLGGTWRWSRHWTSSLSDTYVDVGTAMGHVVSASVTGFHNSGMSATLHGVTTVDSTINTRQFGLKLRLDRHISWFGGIYAGETRDPVLLTEVGQTHSDERVPLRQAYVGCGIPLGKYTLQTIYDQLRLGGATRRELSLVLKVPIGSAGRVP